MKQSFMVILGVPLVLAACASAPQNNTETNRAENSSAQPVVKTADGDQGAVVAQQAYQASSVYFDYDRYALKPDERAAVQKNSEWLQAHPQQSVLLQGNTDDRGSAEYNLALGNRRAHAVHQALAAMGVDSKRIADSSLGEESPRATCEEEKCWKQNRRVDFVMQGQ